MLYRLGRAVGLSLVLVCASSLTQAPFSQGRQPQQATLTVDVSHPGAVVDGRFWGSNLPSTALAGQTVDNPDFVAAAQQMGISIVRWPGGNLADAYDWKTNELIRPGRRVLQKNNVSLPKIVRFARALGAELSVTVNFGTMTPQDAADLVEFLNGPSSSTWGSKRAQIGFPEPLNVRFFEIGNEENQAHMWFYAWTAENPLKYFLGGDEARRGNAPPSGKDPFGKKGDVFKADGGPNQRYTLRFVPVKDVRVFWAADQAAAQQHQQEAWHKVDDLTHSGAQETAFELDEATGALRFGDGVHGAIPPAGFFLVEYTTYGHKGFVDFARAMRAAPSAVPLQIGAASLPMIDGQPLDLPRAKMVEIFQQMDFHVVHHYNARFPYTTYTQRRQIAYERTQNETAVRLQEAADELGIDKTIGVGVTEWNIFLDARFGAINRNLEGAVIAAEYFIRALNAQPELPLLYAQQFALAGGFLSLFDTVNLPNMAPMGYVFEGFKPWKTARKLPVVLDPPAGLAYDRTLPFVQAASALSPDGQTLLLAISNSAESEAIPLQLSLVGFEARGGVIRRLEGPSIASDNESNPHAVVLRDEAFAADFSGTLRLEPHSVVFLELHRGGVAKAVGHAALLQAIRAWVLGRPASDDPGLTVGDAEILEKLKR